MRKKLMAVLLSFVLALSCVACGDSSGIESVDNVNPVSDETDTQPSEDTALEDTTLEDTTLEDTTFGRGTIMSLEKEGSIVINRNVELGDVPMGEEGTWTVFVYLCATDLESAKERGFASLDIQEMLEASTGENVRFVIQTGGTNKWCNNIIEESELGRYEICNGSITKIDAQPDASMGNPDTLADFLKWGIKNYPAANMGLIFWNHGGGSIVGVCVDERWNRDKLNFTEIDAALAMASKEMTDKFEFIGFDACLMATVESANILAPYANYMYASEETEAGYGWDYAAIGNYLGMNPNANGAELGQVVCDSFFDMLEEIGQSDKGTLSVTDLSKLDNLLKRYHLYAKDIDAASKDLNVFTLVVRGLRDAEWFGNNSKATGYTNMIDLAGVVSAGTEYSTNASQVLEAIDEAVVYVRNGSLHEDSCGLSTYYPLSFNGQTEIEIFADIAVSPYYLSFVTRTAYGLEHNGDMSGYVEEEVVDVWNDTWSGEDTTEGAENYWDNFANTEITGGSQLIQFEQEPIITDGWEYTTKSKKYEGKTRRVDGICYAFKLTEESDENVAAVHCNTWVLSPDGKYLLELGNRAYLDIGQHYGSYHATFSRSYNSIRTKESSMWGMGEMPIAAYIVSEDPKRNRNHYMVPMLVNDEATYLHMVHRTSNGHFTFEGKWDGLDLDGIAGRELENLEDSDVITPIYNAILLETGEQTIYYGAPVEHYNSGPRNNVYDNIECFINIEIIDVFGNSYVTDYVRYKYVDRKLVDYEIVESLY